MTLRVLGAAAVSLLVGALIAGLLGEGVEPGDVGVSGVVLTTDAPQTSSQPDESTEPAGPGLPGEDLARIDPAAPPIRSGEVDASPGIRLVGEVGLQGAFAEAKVGTDLAFKGRYAFAGNYEGFSVYDIGDPTSPQLVTNVVCPGPQGDVSVFANLLVLSVDEPRDDETCESRPAAADDARVGPAGPWEGIRVFDIADPSDPRLLTSVATECGSHTHTLAPSRDGRTLWVYVSSFGPGPDQPTCRPPHDSISVVEIPVADGAAARVVVEPVLFPGGGQPGGGYSSETSGCHDLTTFPSKDLAAGACLGDGILLDISDRARPRVISRVRDTENFALWHSATFNADATKVVFSDERGSGSSAECNPDVGPTLGADGIYDIVEDALVLRSYFKIPRTQSDTENCVAHNGSLVPVPGRDVMVQGWYQGGTSIFDFTDSANPVELEYFDRGALSDDDLFVGGSWSSYWYNGYVYSSDITRGLEVFAVDAPWADAASGRRLKLSNAQTQRPVGE